jgi:methyl-accepting chemotaxis protein
MEDKTAHKRSVGSAIARFYLRSYADEGASSQSQAKALVYTNLAMALATLAASAVMVEREFSLLLLGMSALSIGLSFLVKAGAADLASAATTLLLSAAFAAMPFLGEFLSGYELYLLATMQCLVIMITGVVARKSWQSQGVMAIAITALTVDFFARVNPVTKGINFDDYVICVLVVAISATMGRVIMARNARLLAASEAEAAKDRERLEHLSAALESSKGSLSMGVAVSESAERTRELIDELRASALAAKNRVDELAMSAQAIAEAQSEIALSSGTVGENISEQIAIVTESSAAIEEMTASVGNISSATDSRRGTIVALKERTGAGAKEMANATEAVKAMEASSSSILDVVAVIRGVASRTNLLAMNAAIEAAHAGEAGKGFAVVADEIRKLSEATGQNVKLISTSIKGTIDSVRAVADTNARAREIFGLIDAEVDEVSAALEEVARGLGEITSGTDEILKGTSESVSVTNKVKEASSNVDERIRLVEKEIDVLGGVATDVEARLSAIVSGLDSILGEASAVSEAGKANEAGLRELTQALAAIG